MSHILNIREGAPLKVKFKCFTCGRDKFLDIAIDEIITKKISDFKLQKVCICISKKIFFLKPVTLIKIYFTFVILVSLTIHKTHGKRI